MLEQFLLAERAWIPVVCSSGRRDLVRLCDIGRADILHLSTGRPDCDISLTEFLIGLLSVALPPKDDDDWFERLETPATEGELQAAFAPLRDALILDGPGPRFFQDFDNLEGEAGGIAGLLIDAPGTSTQRDNADHFVKRGQTEVLSRAGAAIVLATLQTSAPSGGAGHRTSLRGGGPLTTLVVPGATVGGSITLWQRLWANVVQLSLVSAEDYTKVFPWLVQTRVSDKAGQSTTPGNVHLAQTFFGMPRRIRLSFEPNPEKRPCDLLGIVDEIVVTGYITRPWGTNYEGWDRKHPLSPYYKPKPKEPTYLPVHLQSARVGYREWLGLALGEQDGARVPAKCVQEFRNRVGTPSGLDASIRTDARLLAAGYAMDNMKPLDFGEALMPLIVGSTPNAHALIQRQAESLIDAAGIVASQLTTSVRTGLYGERAKIDGDSSVLRPIRDRFWSDTEQSFFDTLSATARAINDAKDALQDAHHELARETGDTWRKHLTRHALKIFDNKVPIEAAEARRIEDVISARKSLVLLLTGHRKSGGAFFKALGLQPPEAKVRKVSKKGEVNETA